VLLNKNAEMRAISHLVPNKNYQVSVGDNPSSPCKNKIPTAWSSNFTESCITEPEGTC